MHSHHEKTHRLVGFFSCVAPTRCNPASHGGVTIISACRCGAERRVCSTGPARRESSGWVSAREEED